MARLSRIRPVSSTRVSTETHAARSTSTKEKKLTSPPSRRSFAKRSPSTVLASRNLRRKRSPKRFRPHAPLQRNGHRLLDRHRALLPADRLHRLRATAPAAGGGGVHPPRLPRLLPGGALVGQAPRRGAVACAGAGAAQGVGLCRLRHRPRLCADRPPLGGRWPGGVGLAGGHRRALGALVLLLAPPAGHAGERLRLGHVPTLPLRRRLPA